ncbi:hypothetical protein [Streptomyces mirabilis]|uniref:hypothetical protein n=1 Tax=Streptomyces mirabilis TaxID=68239 RepID=UPI003408F47F
MALSAARIARIRGTAADLPRGRRRTLHLRSLLIGLHLCTQATGGKIVLERVTDILYFRTTPRMRALLDIPEYPDHDQGFEAAYAVVRRLFHAMKDAMNPSPLPCNKNLSCKEARQLAANAAPDDLAEREQRLALFTEFILDASVRPLHSLLSELAEVSLGVDATPVRTFSRGRRANGPSSPRTPTPAGTYAKATTETPTRPSPAPCAHPRRPPRRAAPKLPSARRRPRSRRSTCSATTPT